MIKPRNLGHIVIRVRDLKRSEEFYNKFLGLEVSGRGGDSMVFFRSNQSVHHDLAIAKIADDAPGPEQDRVGLYHIAYEFDSFDQLQEAYRMTKEMGIRIAGFGYLLFEARDFQEQAAFFGEDPFPMGIKANEKMLNILFKNAFDQGLTKRQIKIEEVFYSSILDT